MQEKEPGLYEVLRGRKLLDEIGLGNKNADFVNWGDIPDCEMAFLARRLIAESGIGGRRELQKEDSGLYCALLKRELLDKTGLAEKHRDWAGMENNELVAHAREGIAGRRKLAKANGGLYAALLKRDLLDEIGLPDSNGRHRSWAGMGNGELVAHAKGFIAEKGIAGKEELKNSDSGLYQVLYKRKLLDAGFSDMEASRALEKEGAILRRIREALGEYSGDGR